MKMYREVNKSFVQFISSPSFPIRDTIGRRLYYFQGLSLNVGTIFFLVTRPKIRQSQSDKTVCITTLASLRAMNLVLISGTCPNFFWSLKCLPSFSRYCDDNLVSSTSVVRFEDTSRNAAEASKHGENPITTICTHCAASARS